MNKAYRFWVHYRTFIVMGIVTTILAFLFVQITYSNVPNGKNLEVMLDGNFIYTGAATVTGLAIFGSALSFKIKINRIAYNEKKLAIQ